jgi:hypothetical protein
MVSTLRKAIDRMKAWRLFRRAMARVQDGTEQQEVLALLGPPDGIGGREPGAGIELRWEYYDRLPDHVDFVVAFSGGSVRCCFTRDLPHPQRHRAFREAAGPPSALGRP